MSLATKALPAAATMALATMVNVVSVSTASAHVKWFCAYDVAGQPRNLENVLCPNFELLVGMAIMALLFGCFIEGTPLGEALQRAFNRVTVHVRDNTELMVRGGGGFFFVAIWALGGIILTPELKTTSVAIGILQLAIAAGLLSRRTMPLSGVGIFVLFGAGLYQYGAFHMADYPIFLGIAAYLVLVGLQRDLFGLRPLDVMRWASAITLMWASIEKWAYPEWTFPLFIEHPAMSLGYDREFFMQAAGVVEFTLAFALLWTPLVRRVAAVLLVGMFVGAILEFGKIDAIGHSMIIVVLLALIADDVTVQMKVRYPLLVPVGYGTALAAFLALYYVSHAALFGTSIV
jgi:hypothetical protein